MITDAIFRILQFLYLFIITLVPKFDFISDLVSAKEQFITFISSFMQYTLYIFNVPVLRVAVLLLINYIGFVVVEYFVKLGLKYFTSVV